MYLHYKIIYSSNSDSINKIWNQKVDSMDV